MPTNTKINRYFGKLTPAQIAQGMNCANSNAKRLLTDAELLCENRSYPSAVGLAILAIEEAGKEGILRSLVLARNANELKSSWVDFRTHTEKNRLLAIPNMLSSGAKGLEDFLPLFKKDCEYPRFIENLKQVSFYSDCLGKAQWSSPSDVIEEELAKRVIALAKAMVEIKHEVTEKEVELWIKHIGPVWKMDWELMKDALKNWYMEMIQLGLLNGSVEDALRFVDGKKDWVH